MSATCIRLNNIYRCVQEGGLNGQEIKESMECAVGVSGLFFWTNNSKAVMWICISNFVCQLFKCVEVFCQWMFLFDSAHFFPSFFVRDPFFPHFFFHLHTSRAFLSTATSTQMKMLPLSRHKRNEFLFFAQYIVIFSF